MSLKKLRKILIMYRSLSATELRLNHLNRPLNCVSIRDRVGSLFYGSPGIVICSIALDKEKTLKAAGKLACIAAALFVMMAYFILHFSNFVLSLKYVARPGRLQMPPYFGVLCFVKHWMDIK